MYGLDPSFGVFILCWFFVIPVVTGMVASGKGRRGVLWGVLAFLLSPVAFIILLCLPSLKACPQCATSCPKEAKVCAHCGYRFQQDAVQPH